MWLSPFPALLSLALWIYIFFTGPAEGVWFSVIFFLLSVAAYYFFLRTRGGEAKPPPTASE